VVKDRGWVEMWLEIEGEQGHSHDDNFIAAKKSAATRISETAPKTGTKCRRGWGLKRGPAPSQLGAQDLIKPDNIFKLTNYNR